MGGPRIPPKRGRINRRTDSIDNRPDRTDNSKCVYNILKHKYENLFFNSNNSDTGVTKTGSNKLRTYAKLKHEY